MRPRFALLGCLLAMAILIAAAVLFPHGFEDVLRRPALYPHARLLHVLSATLFFGNVVIGTIWETRSLLSRDVVIVRHTYETVTWLDAVFTAPLILCAVVSGLMLGTLRGGVFGTAWLVVAFALFGLTGLLWLAFDIPSQYRVKRLFRALAPDTRVVPAQLLSLLRLRLVINVCAIVPLLVVFGLMVHKPELPAVQRWLAP